MDSSNRGNLPQTAGGKASEHQPALPVDLNTSQLFGSGNVPMNASKSWIPRVNCSLRVISVAAGPAVTNRPTAQSSTLATGSNQGLPPDLKAAEPVSAAAGAGVVTQPVVNVLLVTLDFQAPSNALFRTQTTLSQVRAKLKATFPVTTPFVFCNETGAALPDILDLQTYFSRLKSVPSLEKTTCNVYVTASRIADQGASLAAITDILSKQFYVRFLRIMNPEKSNIEGSMDSSLFKGKSAAQTTLNVFRSLIKGMSIDARQDCFSLPDGTPVDDTTPLLQYLTMARYSGDVKEKVPSVPVFYKRTADVALHPTSSFLSGAAQGGIGGPSGALFGGSGGGARAGMDPSVLAKLGPLDLSLTDRTGQDLQRDKTALAVKEVLDAKDWAARGGSSVHANKLNEGDWDLILKNCNAFCGWIIDFKNNKIKRAPRPAFRLRKGLNLERVVVKSEQPASKSEPDTKGSARMKPVAETEKTVDKSSQLPPLQQEAVKEFMPRKAQAIPNFTVTDNCDIQIAAIQHEFSESLAKNHFDKTTFEAEASGVVRGVTLGGNVGATTQNSSGTASAAKEIRRTLLATYRVPRVTVYLTPEDLELTDDFAAAIQNIRETKNLFDLRKLQKTFGQIFCSEIVLGGCLQTSKTLTAKELNDESQARNSFRASVGLAVGVPKVANASFKASHEVQNGIEQGQRTFDQAENLAFSATGGDTILAADPPAWLSTVGTDFNYWRVIHQLQILPLMGIVSQIPSYEEVQMWFLQAVPRLTEYIVIPPSRLVDTRLKVHFQREGLVRALAGLDANKHRETSADGLPTQTYLAHVATHPPTFVRTTVKRTGGYTERTEGALRSSGGRTIIDVTESHYQTTETTTEAVFYPASTQSPVLVDPRALPYVPPTKPKMQPARKDNIAVPAKPIGDAPKPATAKDGKSGTPDAPKEMSAVEPAPGKGDAQKDRAVPALKLALESSTEEAEQVVDPQDMADISAIDKRTVWQMEVPYGYSLKHGSLVTIKSTADSNSKVPLHMTVYRNGQGVFLPAITSTPDSAYWRVLKADHDVIGATTNSDVEQLKYGDPVRLCWRFSDQTSGWRDFYDDHYGRRRFDTSSDVQHPSGGGPCVELYLKAPFPRFEALSSPSGMAMILSGANTTEPVLETIKLKDRTKIGGTVGVTYNLHDLTFRLDYVTPNTVGEQFDYMNVKTGEDYEVETSNTLVGVTHRPETQSFSDVMRYAAAKHSDKNVAQWDKIVNSASTGSPGEFIGAVAKGIGMSTTPGMLASMLGLW